MEFFSLMEFTNAQSRVKNKKVRTNGDFFLFIITQSISDILSTFQQ